MQKTQQELDQSTPFQARYRRPAPGASNAQAAATRVYNTGGVLKRNDPFVGPKDRFGNSFNATQWAEEGQPEQQSRELQPPLRPEPSPDRLKNAGVAELIADFRDKILERGGAAGIHSLGRIFRLMDTDDNRRISADELQTGLEHYGLYIERPQIEMLLGALDKDNSGNLRVDEFLMAIRGGINQRREKMINMAFKVLDKTGNGVITMEDIEGTYSTDHDADVLAGRLPSNAAMENFLGQFDTIKSDGIVTGKEFIEYYRSISASIDNDDYFELMIRNAWHIPGGEGWCENTSNVRLLVISHSGAQKVVMIKDDLGLDLKDRDAVMAALKAQGETDVYKFTLSGDI